MSESESRPVSPGSAASKSAAAKKGAALKRGQNSRKVVIEAPGAEDTGDAAVARALQQQLSELQQQLRDAQEDIAKRDRTVSSLEQQLEESGKKHAVQLRANAKRLIQISTLDRALEAERARSKLMVDELVKQTRMMDLVITFRDRESARDVNELLQENMELSTKVDTWKERAQTLQQERWGFVQKFRAARGDSDGALPDAVAHAGSDDEEDEEGRDDAEGRHGAGADSDDDE